MFAAATLGKQPVRSSLSLLAVCVYAAINQWIYGFNFLFLSEDGNLKVKVCIYR